MFFWMRGNNWEQMGINDTKRDNLGVHGVINVLLWYCQEFRGGTYEVSALFIMFGGDGKLSKRDKFGLNPRQRAFADEYIISANATQAAIKAGYSQNYANTNASKLLQNTTIKSYIDEKLAELQSQKVADQQEVMEYLTAVMRGEKTEPLLVLDGEGKQKVVNAVPPVQARTKAAELLGKRYRLFTDKVELDATVEQVVFEDDIS